MGPFHLPMVPSLSAGCADDQTEQQMKHAIIEIHNEEGQSAFRLSNGRAVTSDDDRTSKRGQLKNDIVWGSPRCRFSFDDIFIERQTSE